MTLFFDFKRGQHRFEIFKAKGADGVLYSGYHDGEHICTAADAEIVVRTLFRECIYGAKGAKAA